jgi:hypothetical protein
MERGDIGDISPVLAAGDQPTRADLLPGNQVGLVYFEQRLCKVLLRAALSH